MLKFTLRAELRNVLRAELRNALRAELTSVVRAEFRNTSRAAGELRNVLRAELRNTLRAELPLLPSRPPSAAFITSVTINDVLVVSDRTCSCNKRQERATSSSPISNDFGNNPCSNSNPISNDFGSPAIILVWTSKCRCKMCKCLAA